jgi:hypothetical protein
MLRAHDANVDNQKRIRIKALTGVKKKHAFAAKYCLQLEACYTLKRTITNDFVPVM